MRPRIRRLVVIVGASTALGVAGCGGAASSQNAGAQSGAGSPSQAQGAQAQPGPGGFDLSALATRLGVTESKLRTAMQKSRPTGPPGSSSATDPTATLAKELGLSAAKVRAAMQALAPAGGTGDGTPPSGSVPAPGTSTSGGSAA